MKTYMNWTLWRNELTVQVVVWRFHHQVSPWQLMYTCSAKSSASAMQDPTEPNYSLYSKYRGRIIYICFHLAWLWGCVLNFHYVFLFWKSTTYRSQRRVFLFFYRFHCGRDYVLAMIQSLTSLDFIGKWRRVSLNICHEQWGEDDSVMCETTFILVQTTSTCKHKISLFCSILFIPNEV